MIIRNFQCKNNKETKNKTTVPGTHPSNTKQCKMLQNFEQRVWMYERGLYFRIPTNNMQFFFFFPFIFISWRLISLQYCSGFCHTLTWISHGFTCIPHPEPHSHLPLHPIPLGLPSAPGPSTCLMHPAWAGDLCPTLFDPMDCSPPGSCVHGILQARILQWVAMPFLQGNHLDSGIEPKLFIFPALASGFFSANAPWEALITAR